MQTAINNIINFLTLNWLTGPIFDKELRVSSRRKRNYFVRFAYLAFLTIAMIFVWIEQVDYYGSTVYQASRMSQAGMVITAVIVWFQFIAAQILAVVMLSTAISDEIYNKTLATLMTTPITSFQIVMGKLLSKLLQIFLLIAITFPLLSMVRVFGGIPWNYVVSSICLTVSTVILVGSLSLFYSIFTRKAYVSIIFTVLTIFLVYMVCPVMMAMGGGGDDSLAVIVGHTNPFVAMGFNTGILFVPGGAPFFFSWQVACGIVLTAAGLLIACCVSQVRRVGQRQASGETAAVVYYPDDQAMPSSPVLDIPAVSGDADAESDDKTSQPDQQTIRRIKRSPVLWKEMRSPLLGTGAINVLYILAIGFSLILIMIFYSMVGSDGGIEDKGFHASMAVVYMAIGFLFTAILPATMITSEKESRTWHLLLATTLTDWQIVFGKVIGSLRRCLLPWCYLFGHILLFMLFGIIHPLGLLQVIIIVAGMCVLLTGSGIYFSALFKRTTTAVTMNIIFAAFIWLAMPVLLLIIYNIADMYEWFLAIFYCYTIPFVQVVDSMAMTASGIDDLGTSEWFDEGFSATLSTIFMLIASAINTAAGLLFIWRAKKRFRKKIF